MNPKAVAFIAELKKRGRKVSLDVPVLDLDDAAGVADFIEEIFLRD
jgi:hypothetical protein